MTDLTGEQRDIIAATTIAAALQARWGFLPFTTRYGLARHVIDQARPAGCQCGHDVEAHEHDLPGTGCVTCGPGVCPEYRAGKAEGR